LQTKIYTSHYLTPFPLIFPPPSKVRRRRRLCLGRTTHPSDGNTFPRRARDPNRQRLGTKTTGVLKEIIRSPCRALPRRATVRADLQLGDRLVGVDDLHGEPVRARAGLAVQDDRGRYAACHGRVRDVDDSGRDGAQLLEGVLE
jgi:hypothetical protein